MKRRLRRLLSAVTLLLLAALALVWARSYWQGYEIGYRWAGSSPPTNTEFSLASFSGSLSLSRSGWITSEVNNGEWFFDRHGPRRGYDMDWEFAGFEYRQVTALHKWLWEFRVPMWAVAALLAAVPALHVISSLRRRRRTAAGFCARCGYDLRASNGRCPECGAATAQVVEPARVGQSA